MPCLMGLSKARVKGSTSANKRTLGVIPALVSVAAAVLGVDVGGDVLTVDLSSDELLLGDGDAGDDDDGEGDGVNGGLDAADVGQSKAGQTGEVLKLHFGCWFGESGSWKRGIDNDVTDRKEKKAPKII